MKIIFKNAVLAALVIATSCGKDDSNSNSEQSEEQAELLENKPLAANLISDNVIIEGSTKEEGEIPAPNGAISLDLSNTTKTALLGEGFDISLSSDADVVGAYLRFKSEDGSEADSYYDINLESNILNSKSAKRAKSRHKNASTFIKKIDDTSLEVDFNATVEAGKFCYELCVYDAQGNISNPQEVCLKVEGWGGNPEAIGTWKLVKTYRDEFPNDIKLPNVDNCEMINTQRSCLEGALSVDYSYESCEIIEYFEITMNSDGTYTERYKDISKNTIEEVVIPEEVEGLTIEELATVCGTSFSDSERILTEESDGYWYYINDKNNFIFVEYNYEEIYDGEVYSDSYEVGDGSIYYGSGVQNGEVQITNGKLVISGFEFQTIEFEK